MAAWCSKNNRALNTKKTKEIIEDFRRNSIDLALLYINIKRVERVRGSLGGLISTDILWADNNTAVIKRAQQQLHFLRV